MGGLPPGAVVSGYQVVRLIAAGRSGEVYLARHPRLPRHDAVKVLAGIRADDPRFRARFLREAELAARLDHPNIVTVHDCGSTSELLWIAMEFVDGYDAATLIRRHPAGLSPERAVALVTAAAAGLDAAHHAGLLHLDVKPANLLIEPGGDRAGDRVLVADFGIARAADEFGDGPQRTVGTLAYTAPELISGRPADRRSDIYSLGCTLYQLLTGRVPFPRGNPAAVMHAHLTVAPPPPSTVSPAVPVALDAVVRSALAKDPDDRYDSCGALAWAAGRALEAAADAAEGTPRVGDAGRNVRRAASPRRRWIRAGLVAAVLAAGTAIAVSRMSSPDSPGAAVTTAPVSTSAAAVSSWAAHQFVVDTVPRLLPATPSVAGYQGLRCSAIDEQGQSLPLDQLGRLAQLMCGGDYRPVRVLQVLCNTDRTPIERPATGEFAAQETWTRSSGSGLVAWRDSTDSTGKPYGRLRIFFDEPSRNFCVVEALGGAGGQELHDDWWPGAPI
ncbi:serine/threonine protein kinase [Nocardia sp. 2]|uniref:non-specific serine/threonine protein kinase n=1 Tax=Nocardia acididurans TaxID=2802282 RepID=A0ABS1M8G7_9NOCA|nr:serine/threonine-protein kinase [Nocardia acididurans]MBL1076937.1 serine/threonine protein kinase [Nocardia acididurans]